MPLAEIMFEQLAAARRIVEDDQEVVPSWRIATPEGELKQLPDYTRHQGLGRS
jgi:hypothetical protein